MTKKKSRQKITDVVASVISDIPDDGWEIYISCRRAWRYCRYITDEEKDNILKALSKAGYKPNEVRICRVGETRMDLGEYKTYVCRH